MKRLPKSKKVKKDTFFTLERDINKLIVFVVVLVGIGILASSSVFALTIPFIPQKCTGSHTFVEVSNPCDVYPTPPAPGQTVTKTKGLCQSQSVTIQTSKKVACRFYQKRCVAIEAYSPNYCLTAVRNPNACQTVTASKPITQETEEGCTIKTFNIF